MLTWFPVTGALIGASVGVVWWAGAQVWPPFVAAVIALVADLAFTGMLHMDGLVDAADALLPHMKTERRLEVMAEPTVGAFGVVVAVVAVLLRVAALVAIEPNVLLLAAFWATSRTLMAATLRGVPYARAGEGGGLATAMIGGSPWALTVLGLAFSAVLGALAFGALGVGSVAAGAAAFMLVIALGRRQVGGFTGDVLGGAGVVGETVALLVAAVR
ncbi:MAG: adenosylcobinamide-GDP ribazoletransferase [Actinomycetota bacterium]|jgi:adenosylcobinamide-GDP ribazoletransferase